MPRPRRSHRESACHGLCVRSAAAATHTATARHRGGILFEVMLAVALFAGGAAFTLGAVRSVYQTLERSQKQQQAIDLARTRMAELEAGLITISDLRGETAGAGDSPSRASRDASAFDEQAVGGTGGTVGGLRWRTEVRTSRTEFTGLTLVELTVIESLPREAEAAGGAGANPMRYTLRQLVAVREDEGRAWEEDDLTQGLPTTQPEGGR